MQTNVIETMFNVILNHYNVMYNIVRVHFPTLICHFWTLSKKFLWTLFWNPLSRIIIHWISFRLHPAHQLAVCGCVCCVCTACLHRERESTPHLHSCSTHTCIPADTQTMKAHNSCEDSSKLQMNVYSLTYFILICNSQEAKQHSLL